MRSVPGDKKKTGGPAEELVNPEFTEGLLRWNRQSNSRQMPWKGEKDIYRIWLSEIILQQTRVEQGLKYYQNFISRFPDIHTLAKAPEDEVYKYWEGLGYYSRCRNLIATARYISNELDGKFPSDYHSILNLKGVGPYTAAAIASFAYNLPHAVLDGNVFRVLSRITGNDTPIDSAQGKKIFTALANQLLPEGRAGIYNQAIMDFGATICKPVPVCASCFYRLSCIAYQSGRQDLLPVREKSIKQKNRWMYYFLVEHNSELLIRKRSGSDIWKDLHEFLLIEAPGVVDKKILPEIFQKQFGFQPQLQFKAELKQKLTHQQVCFFFYRITLKNKIDIPGFTWVKTSEIDQFAFPKSLQQYLLAQQF